MKRTVARIEMAVQIGVQINPPSQWHLHDDALGAHRVLGDFPAADQRTTHFKLQNVRATIGQKAQLKALMMRQGNPQPDERKYLASLTDGRQPVDAKSQKRVTATDGTSPLGPI